MADKARGIHVSPGIYSREVDLTYAVKSLGITTLGLVGETLKGPAFEPISIEDWGEFQDRFGGTSPEKFKGSQYPKYELPYIAKTYLTKSKQLEVVRVLGMSGYNAGPAWAITAKRGDKNMVIAVIRSRGYYNDYEKYEANPDNCVCGLGAHDKLHYYVGERNQVAECKYITHYNSEALQIGPYKEINSDGDACEGFDIKEGLNPGFGVSTVNYGKFNLSGFIGTNSANTFSYAVSLNPADKNYILKVLGTTQSDGDAPIYVESLYDVALIQGIESKEINYINSALTFYDVCHIADFNTVPAVNGFVSKPEGSLTRSDLGKRFLFARDYNNLASTDTTFHKYQIISGKTVEIISEEPTTMVDGDIYTVRMYIDASAKKHYYYTRLVQGSDTSGGTIENADQVIEMTMTEAEAGKARWQTKVSSTNLPLNPTVIVKNNSDGLYYAMVQNKIAPVTCDLNNYKSSYNFASTPWIVSNLKGDLNHIEMNRLFRFHTISDGNTANNEVKVSIANINPDRGTFTVQVRDINDSDFSPVIYESFANCTLVPGDKNYIAYKIGSYDGIYDVKSKYITVEVNENTTTKNSIPCGFLGYPVSHFGGNMAVGNASKNTSNIIPPVIKYNTNYDEDIKNRKQYFGLSDLVGVDVDMFTYKGVAAYLPENNYLYPQSITNGFHLDSRASVNSYSDSVSKVDITVDGQSGFTFDCVSPNNVTDQLQGTPIIGTEGEMEDCIYSYENLRKFTVYFYGGFDGWDEYRNARTTGDNYMLSKYKGELNNVTGTGFAFDRIKDPDLIGLNQKGMTSDFYAYLAGIRQFANPEKVDINVFATPGIDYVNNKKLVEEAIEMIEEERADSIYITTTPDKPYGANDYVDQMYTPEEVVDNLESSEIDSNYTATYYPWVKYEDKVNNQFIYLPPTKDIVRNLAMTDNVAFPWYAPAGLDRGDIECSNAHFTTKLGDEDILYSGRINPIKTFAKEGVKVWGQKTLQIRDSQLNRINVRRLLLRTRKLIAIACLGLIFEPNDDSTKDKFLSTVTPILDNIRANRGISDYKISVDDSQEARDRLELAAAIHIKPINALEYIDLTFVITPQGMEFIDL